MGSFKPVSTFSPAFSPEGDQSTAHSRDQWGSSGALAGNAPLLRMARAWDMSHNGLGFRVYKGAYIGVYYMLIKGILGV